MNHYEYFKFWLNTVFGLILSIAIFNLVIDPFGHYYLIDIPSINMEKTQVGLGGGRVIKTMELLAKPYKSVILGTSRANIGIDPQHPAIPQPAYNAALNGTNIYEMEKLFNFIIDNCKSVNLIVFSLDFLTFSNRRTTNADFAESMLADENQLITKLQQTFSIAETHYALKTVIDNIQRRPAQYKTLYTDQGLAKQIFQLPHRTLFQDILRTNFFVNEQTYAGFCYSQDRLNRFRQMIRVAQQHEITVKLFISPIHARQLEAIRVMKLYPIFEQWKRDLTTVLSEEKAIYTLWDFTGYNRWTTEAIPVDPKQTMQWYWESSHYKIALGNKVLDRLFADHFESDDFGVILTPEGIEMHLAQIRRARQAYQNDYPQEINELETLAQQVAHKTTFSPCIAE